MMRRRRWLLWLRYPKRFCPYCLVWVRYTHEEYDVHIGGHRGAGDLIPVDRLLTRRF